MEEKIDKAMEMAFTNKTLIESHIKQCAEERVRIESEFKELWLKLDKMNGKLWGILVLLMVIAIESALGFLPAVS